jgi:microcompartment protein CcmK/EutM
MRTITNLKMYKITLVNGNIISNTSKNIRMSILYVMMLTSIISTRKVAMKYPVAVINTGSSIEEALLITDGRRTIHCLPYHFSKGIFL